MYNKAIAGLAKMKRTDHFFQVSIMAMIMMISVQSPQKPCIIYG
jgi:hypothetical protein